MVDEVLWALDGIKPEKCYCAQEGTDGTKEHNATSLRIVVHLSTKSRVYSCNNHIELYANSPYFKEILE